MLKVTIHESINFTDKELIKLQQAREYLEIAVNTSFFKTLVLNHKYLGRYQFANNEGRTNEEVYNLLMSGREVLSPEIDNEIDIRITIYNTFIKGRNTVGYTYPYTNMQWINRRFFNSRNFTAAHCASNCLHEYLHKQGWGHDFKATARRPYSIPYAVGGIVLNNMENKYYLEHRE